MESPAIHYSQIQEMNKKETNILALLRYALGTCDSVSPMNFAEIRKIYEEARRQSLTALLYSALAKNNLRPLDFREHEDDFGDLLMKWMSEKMKVERQNEKMNLHVAEVTQWLDCQGFECCLLKGQGNALLYPDPALRTPGDIDLWVRSKKKKSIEDDTISIINLVNQYSKGKWRALYHHVEGLAWDGIPVELHYRPRFMLNLVNDVRLQRYFLSHVDEDFNNFITIGGTKIAIPTEEFNVVFQLCHIFEHIMHEGIGLRQIVDYFYVLKKFNTGLSIEEREARLTSLDKLLRRLGLYYIAGALMWILEEKLGMPGEWAIVPPDEKRGRFVLNEILRGGNFGKYDERNRRFGQSRIGRNVQRLVRDFRLVRYFPSEALSEPFFRLWHAVWRWRHN